MRIWELADSTAESAKLSSPDVTPMKNSFAKVVEPVKSACRNSYTTGSAAFAKFDSAVRTIRLRRRTAAYEKVSAEEVEEPGKTNSCGGIWEQVDSTAESAKRSSPDVTPVKKAFAKVVEPVKSACRNSYTTGSAAFAQIDSAVRTIRVRRRTAAYEKISAEEVEEPVKTNSCGAFTRIGDAVATPVKSVCRNSCSYGFITFAKIGYAVRVRGVCRIVQWMSDDGTKSIIGVYATEFAQNRSKLIPGRGVEMPVKNECRSFYTIDFMTFARIGYVVRVNSIDRIPQLMTGADAKHQIIMFTTILARNARKHGLQHRHRFISGRAAICIILVHTFIDVVNENMKLWKEKAESSSKQHSSGSQEFNPGMKYASDNGNDLYSAAYESLKDKVGVFAMNEVLGFMVREFGAFLRKEPFHAQVFSKGILTMESLVFMMREFFESMMKQFFGDQFFSGIDEILVAVLRDIFGINFFDESGFHGSSKKGRKKKGKHMCY